MPLAWTRSGPLADTTDVECGLPESAGYPHQRVGSSPGCHYQAGLHRARLSPD